MIKPIALAACAAVALTTNLSQAANIVVDQSQIEDYNKYQTDLQQCEGLAVQNQPDAPQRQSVAGTAVKGAAVGAAAGGISGGSGSKGAKKGAAIGVVGAAARNQSSQREAQASAKEQEHAIVKNCMIGRGYNVLN